MAIRTTESGASWVLALALAGLGACGDAEAPANEGGEPFNRCESSFATEPSCALLDFEETRLQPLLVTCAGEPDAGGCHSRGTLQTTMELDVTEASVEAEIAALIGQNGLGGALVDTACPDESFLLAKLTENPGGGSRMPFGGPFWSSDEIACFRNYLHDTFGEDVTP